MASEAAVRSHANATADSAVVKSTEKLNVTEPAATLSMVTAEAETPAAAATVAVKALSNC
jgi:hypothetical protein